MNLKKDRAFNCKASKRDESDATTVVRTAARIPAES